MYVFLQPFAIDGGAVADMRENKGIDQGGQKIRCDLMAHVGQANEDTIALFGEGGCVRADVWEFISLAGKIFEISTSNSSRKIARSRTFIHTKKNSKGAIQLNSQCIQKKTVLDILLRLPFS